MLSQAANAVCNWSIRYDSMMHHSDLCNKTTKFALNGYGIFDTDNRNNRRSHPERMDSSEWKTLIHSGSSLGATIIDFLR